MTSTQNKSSESLKIDHPEQKEIPRIIKPTKIGKKEAILSREKISRSFLHSPRSQMHVLLFRKVN